MGHGHDQSDQTVDPFIRPSLVKNLALISNGVVTKDERKDILYASETSKILVEDFGEK